MPKNIKNNIFCFITISMKIWKISYSRVNTKFLLLSSLEIKIALLLHTSSFNCLFLCFGLILYYIYIYLYILIFLYSDQSILRFSHLSFSGEHSLFAVQNPLFSLSSRLHQRYVKLNRERWRQPSSHTFFVLRVHVLLIAQIYFIRIISPIKPQQYYKCFPRLSYEFSRKDPYH